MRHGTGPSFWRYVDLDKFAGMITPILFLLDDYVPYLIDENIDPEYMNIEEAGWGDETSLEQ